MAEQKYSIKLHRITDTDKEMANGMRDMSRTPLSDEEIGFVRSEIRRIEADESLFVFNDDKFVSKSTCYDIIDDKVYVTRNVFPDDKYASAHPRDVMSVGAVLAHEYYGHRTFRDEYLSDLENGRQTIPHWQDECRASITAAKLTPNLTAQDRRDLIMDAVYRAKEAGQLIEMDEFMKEAVYGYSNDEKNITRNITPIRYVSEESVSGTWPKQENERDLSEVRRITKDYYDFGR